MHKWISVLKGRNQIESIYRLNDFHSYEFQKQGKLFSSDKAQKSAIDGDTQVVH